jgi:hypothetical protein
MIKEHQVVVAYIDQFIAIPRRASGENETIKKSINALPAAKGLPAVVAVWGHVWDKAKACQPLEARAAHNTGVLNVLTPGPCSSEPTAESR